MRWLIPTAAIALSIGLSSPSLATPPVSCPPGQVPDPNTGTCTIVVGPPPGPGDAGEPSRPPNPGGGKPTEKWVCTSTVTSPPERIACSAGVGWWVQSRQCYAKAALPQPAASDPVWEGHTDGAVYDCSRPVLGPGGFIVVQFWSAEPPGAGAPPDPRALARRAMATMSLQAVSIGIVPEDRPGSVGLVGMPVWLWDSETSAASWGPVSKTASAGGYSVTATARVSKVVWAMGDGEVVVCHSRGTPYSDALGRKPSPDCGYSYSSPGRYTVRATSYWSVDWAGMGQSGSIPLQFSDTATITVGEVQVLTQ